jgi:hypothetical protein
MKKWLRRIRGAVGMGLTWAAGWALVGVLIELLIDPMGSLVDVWVTALAIPGFLGGAVFSAVLRIAEGHRRFDELSLPRFGAWGAVTGLLLGVLAVSAGMASAIFPDLWLRAAVIIGPTTLLSAVSAVGSALLFRYAAREQTPAGAGPEG